MASILPVLRLCARECVACPEFAAQPDGTVAIYDSASPEHRLVFTRGEISEIAAAAKNGKLDQFC